MIVIVQRPLPDTRTAENSCVYVASCEVAGQRFEAHSRRGAPAELARIFVAAGVADQPVEMRQAGLSGCIRYASLHKMAAHTFEEGDRPLRRVRYRPPPDRGAFGVERHQNKGEAPEPAHSLSGGALPAISPTPAMADT